MTKSKHINIASRIEEFRKSRNLTKKRMAEDTGVSFHSLIKYAQGKAKPGLETLEKIAKTYDVALEYFLTDAPAVTNHLLIIKKEDLISYCNNPTEIILRAGQDQDTVHIAYPGDFKLYPNSFLFRVADLDPDDRMNMGAVFHGNTLKGMYGVAVPMQDDSHRDALVTTDIPRNTKKKVSRYIEGVMKKVTRYIEDEDTEYSPELNSLRLKKEDKVIVVFDNDKTPRFRSFEGISEFQKLIFSGVNINFPSEEKDFDEVQILARVFGYITLVSDQLAELEKPRWYK